MNVQPTAVATPIVESPDVPQLRTILLTDLVDSTAMVERIGDGAAAELFRAHDRLVLQLQNEWRGRLIDRSDGLLLLFERPIDGLGFALDYFSGLKQIGAPHSVELKARAGLHVGEVLSWRNSEEAVRVGAKPVEVEGLAKPMAARLMTMARPGQLLMSAVAEPLTHRAARELGERGQHLVWKSHGRWRFKGVPQPQQIFEVGEPGVTPLRAPPPGPKAWRDIPLWRRPAALAVELALVAAVGLGIWFTTRPQPAIAFNQRDWVVLADLRNLTDQPLLDDSLEQAFRISLEQSRHVNVLSDLKTRDTLARMQREPDTELDRATASEIAIRDGARAVILPTVAEVGGRVRVSAEVIDPHSQTTVYAEYADGKGAVSALASIDEVTGALREKLGEALEAVERDSASLPEVTTENLDALRAYALGVQAHVEKQRAEAIQYYERAIQLDPNFALAYLGAVSAYIGAGDADSAKLYMEKALALRERLPPREALYLDAWSAELGPRPERTAPQKWKLLAELYRDYFAGSANLAWYEFLAADYETALETLRAATVPQNPRRALALNTLGRIQLAQEQYQLALRSFAKGDALSGGAPSRQQVAALGAQRRFKEAHVLVAGTGKQDLTSAELVEQFERIALLVDSGNWDEALKAANRTAIAARQSNALLANDFAFIDLSVRTLHDPASVETADYRRLFDAAIRDAADPESPTRAEHVYIALAAVYLSQRNGGKELARHALPLAAPLVAEIGSRRADQMLQLVRASQLRLSGKTAEAVSALRALVDGRELFQVHVALRDALRADGRTDDALQENRWIASRRGLAYVEPAGGQALQLLNVADTTLALLDTAELQRHSERAAETQASLEAFRRAWPALTLPSYLRRRVETTFPASKQ